MSTTTPNFTRSRYAVLADLLATGIGEGRSEVGSLLPTEHELALIHSVSRATVREALRLLQHRGLIARNQGIGSRVLPVGARTRYVLSAQSATEAMGYTAETQFITRSRRLVRATRALAQRLGVTPGSEWLHLSGVRMLIDEPTRPLALSDIYVAAEFATVADKADAASPIYLLIERERGVRITEIVQDITAIVLTGMQARLLRVPPGGSGLHVVRRFIGPDGQPVEVTRNVHAADRFTFSLRLHPPPS